MKPILATILLAMNIHAAPPESFWKAVHQVETRGKVGWIWGDNRRSLGPLQISKAYHLDSKVPGSWGKCTSLGYSRRVATAYLKRYAPHAWATGDCQTLARIHNGGPKGHKKRATVGYWVKIRKELRK